MNLVRVEAEFIPERDGIADHAEAVVSLVDHASLERRPDGSLKLVFEMESQTHGFGATRRALNAVVEIAHAAWLPVNENGTSSLRVIANQQHTDAGPPEPPGEVSVSWAPQPVTGEA